jgi:hypothetical protein
MNFKILFAGDQELESDGIVAGGEGDHCDRDEDRGDEKNEQRQKIPRSTGPHWFVVHEKR